MNRVASQFPSALPRASMSSAAAKAMAEWVLRREREARVREAVVRDFQRRRASTNEAWKALAADVLAWWSMERSVWWSPRRWTESACAWCGKNVRSHVSLPHCERHPVCFACLAEFEVPGARQRAGVVWPADCFVCPACDTMMECVEGDWNEPPPLGPFDGGTCGECARWIEEATLRGMPDALFARWLAIRDATTFV